VRSEGVWCDQTVNLTFSTRVRWLTVWRFVNYSFWRSKSRTRVFYHELVSNQGTHVQQMDVIVMRLINMKLSQQ